jgi:hypothetical protein
LYGPMVVWVGRQSGSGAIRQYGEKAMIRGRDPGDLPKRGDLSRLPM